MLKRNVAMLSVKLVRRISGMPAGIPIKQQTQATKEARMRTQYAKPRAGSVILALTALSLGGCSGSKELNEQSSRTLLQERVRTAGYLMSVATVTPFMKRTPVDYMRIASGQGVVVRQLLERRFALRQSDVTTLPRVSGRFTLAPDYVGGWLRQGEFVLEPVPNSDQLTGSFDLTLNGVHMAGEIAATVRPDGKVLIYPKHYNWQNDPMELQYVEEGDTGYLVLVARGATSRFVGRASHQKFDVTS
jgi:hypothetical protein